MKPRRAPQPTHQEHDDGSPQECVVWGSMALVLRVSQCAGVAPVRLSAARAGRRAAASPPLASLQRCAITLLNVIAIAALILDSYEEPARRIRAGGTALKTFVSVSDLAMVMAIASLAAYPGQARMERLVRVMNQLQQINRDLNNDPTKKYNTIGVLMVCCLLTWTVAVLVVEIYLHMASYIQTGKNWSIMLMYTPYYIFITQGLLVLMQWGHAVLLVYNAAAALNRHLLRLLRDDELTAHPSQAQGMVRRLAGSYEQIGDIIHKMNAGNGAILIIMLLCKFLHLMETPYYFLLRLNDGRDLPGTVFLLVFWSVVHISTLLLAIETCHWTQGQRETTKFLLSKLMVHLGPRCKRLSQELDQFAKQTLLTSAKFMPLGLYTLARPLMATILGGVTTYLVIIIQFQTF